MKNKYKYLFATIFIIALLIGTITIKNTLKDKNQRVFSQYIDEIIINEVGNIDGGAASIAGEYNDIAGDFYEKIIPELLPEYPFINKVFIFGENTKNQRIGEYRYNQLGYQGYYLMYTDATEKKYVEIFFSKTMDKKPRDVGLVVLDNLKESTIMNVKVKIVHFQSSYIALFDKNGIHFDIETSNITEEELITLIKNVIE